ncbi:hypothetical protein DFH28DRAFT_1120365 [Melampsora americana]|nr:hypothetical protein DFH28DRAFT_1120365 [Melampsora americana]
MRPMRPRWWEKPTPEELAWFNSLDPRSKSEIFRWDINKYSHPAIHAGLDQCFDCGEFGHMRPCSSTQRFRHPPPYQNWRRSINGKIYSKCKLRMTPEALATLAAEEAIEAPLVLSSDDLELLDAIEQTACMAKTQTSSAASPDASTGGQDANQQEALPAEMQGPPASKRQNISEETDRDLETDVRKRARTVPGWYKY